MSKGQTILKALIAVLLLAASFRVGWLAWELSRSKAQTISLIESTQKKVTAAILDAYLENFNVAVGIASDLDFEKAFALRDREAVDQAIRKLLKKNGIQKYHATIILKERNEIFYSSQLAERSSEKQAGTLDLPLIEKALKFRFPAGPNNPFSCGLCELTQQGTFELASFVPIKEKSTPLAVLVVSTDFGSAFLSDLDVIASDAEAKEKHLGMALYVMQGSKVVAQSGNLRSEKLRYIQSLRGAQTDPFGAKQLLNEADGRLWKNLPLWGPDGEHPMGQIIISAQIYSPDLLDIPTIALILIPTIIFASLRLKRTPA